MVIKKQKGTYNNYDLEVSWGQLQIFADALERDHSDPVSDETLAEVKWYMSHIPGPGEEEEEVKAREEGALGAGGQPEPVGDEEETPLPMPPAEGGPEGGMEGGPEEAPPAPPGGGEGEPEGLGEPEGDFGELPPPPEGMGGGPEGGPEGGMGGEPGAEMPPEDDLDRLPAPPTTESKAIQEALWPPSKWFKKKAPYNPWDTTGPGYDRSKPWVDIPQEKPDWEKIDKAWRPPYRRDKKKEKLNAFQHAALQLSILPEDPNMTPEQFRAIVSRAQATQMAAAAHRDKSNPDLDMLPAPPAE
jgi:hypothetical protein